MSAVVVVYTWGTVALVIVDALKDHFPVVVYVAQAGVSVWTPSGARNRLYGCQP